MKHTTILYKSALLALLASLLSLPAIADGKKRYMLEGIATPAVFASVIATPQDRGPNAAGLMKKAGCELLDYYVGVHNYKNYVVIECAANADIAALQFSLYASGAITEATAAEIVTSAELKAVGERAQNLSKAYKTPE
jgi:uncharacterized protein with GYD domain